MWKAKMKIIENAENDVPIIQESDEWLKKREYYPGMEI